MDAPRNSQNAGPPINISGKIQSLIPHTINPGAELFDQEIGK